MGLDSSRLQMGALTSSSTSRRCLVMEGVRWWERSCNLMPTQTATDASAVNVQRAGQKAMATRAATSARERRGGGGWLGTALSAVFVIALAADGYQQFKSYSSGSAAEAGQKELLSETMRQASTAGFKCDGRTYCSQMTSCAEAKYFLKNCPGVQMDGNHDGKPCEQQWCQ